MSTPIEMETTILGGLPVRVRANIQPAERDVGIFLPWPEDIQIFWVGGNPIQDYEVPQAVYDRISEKESDLLNEQIMEEYHK